MCTKSFVVLAFLALPSCMSSDNLELLISTLKMMQRAACDDEMVSLSCPKGTLINIQVAQYGKAVPTQGCAAAQVVEDADASTCLLPNNMQYKLLQKVVETCQKKPHCNFDTKLRPGTEDPCPSTKKYVEVAYKCRPHEFLSVTSCEDQVMKLSCTPYSRIAVMSAQFGYIAHESITTCPQPPGYRDESCSVPYGVETVMQICHGKRQCEVTANVKTFGSSCSVNSKPYLVVAYACVPLGVLTDRYESADEFEEEASSTKVNTKKGHSDDLADPALQAAHDDSQQDDKDSQPAEVMNEPEQSNSKLWVYLGSAVAVFIILLSLLFGIRWYVSNKVSTNSANDMFSPETPNVFNDVSDIDNDIDVSHISGTFYDPIHPDMMLYRDVQGRGMQAVRPLSTIYPVGSRFNNEYIDNSVYRRDKEDPEVTISPKSLGKYSNSQFYYG